MIRLGHERGFQCTATLSHLKHNVKGTKVLMVFLIKHFKGFVFPDCVVGTVISWL